MKRILFNCSILLALTIFLSVDTQAQLKIDRNAGRINPAVKKAAEKQAAINKILNATVNKIEFVISKDKGWSKSIFQSRTLAFNENNNGHFALQAFLGEQQTNVNDNVIFTYVTPTTPALPQHSLFTSTYKDLLNNGFTAGIKFLGRRDMGVHFPLGKEWSADFSCIFYFTDGTVVNIQLQEINVSKKGAFKTTDVLTVSKNIPGSAFPDPENPLVLPQVK